MDQAHDSYAALRSPSYRRLLLGSMLATVATEMQGVAVGWELYRRTDSPMALGLVGLALFLPVLLLSLPAGQAADHFSRKGLLLTAQGLMAVASLGLAALSFTEGPVPLVYVCLFLAGTSRAFAQPARASLLQQVVPEGALANAVTWNSTGLQVASMTGPALGGLVLAWAGGRAGWVLLLAASCSGLCAALLAGMQPRGGPQRAVALSLGSLLAGFRFVWHTRLLLATLTLDLFAVLLGGAMALLPIFARDVLQSGPEVLGLLRAAPALGALLMALVIAHRPPMRRAGPSLLLAVAGFGVATVVFGLSKRVELSFCMLALTGALDIVSVVVRNTLVQVLTPDEMRGRVSAVHFIFISSSNELGAFESGVTARLLGPVGSVVVGGVGTVLVVLAVMLLWPEVVRLGPLHKPS